MGAKFPQERPSIPPTITSVQPSPPPPRMSHDDIFERASILAIECRILERSGRATPLAISDHHAMFNTAADHYIDQISQ